MDAAKVEVDSTGLGIILVVVVKSELLKTVKGDDMVVDGDTRLTVLPKVDGAIVPVVG